MSVIESNFQLAIAGYNDKQHVLLHKIFDKLVHFQIDPKRFEIYKENVSLSYNYEHLLIKPVFVLVYKNVKEFRRRTTISTRCLLFGRFTDGTLLDKARITCSYRS